MIKNPSPGGRPIRRDRLSWTQFTADPQRYERMPYRACGRWGLKLPAISLGAWETFGGYRDTEVARECIFRAFNLGITHFDLANNYGSPPGKAETVVGRTLRELPRDEVIVSTKAGYRMWPGPYGEWGSRKSLVASLDQSLARLGLNYVDIFYSHRFDPETPLEETIGALDAIVRSGKALYAAVSNYPAAALREAARLVTERNWAPIIADQPRYNMLGRDVEDEVLPAARELRMGIVAFSPLAQGMLTDKYLDGVPADSRAASPIGKGLREQITPQLTVKLRRLNEIAQTRGQTLAQMALAWILRRPEVTTVLTGASDVKQVEENVKALDQLAFSEDELRRIDDALVDG